MNILYVANIRFPTEKAHGIQIAKTTEALAKREVLEGLWVTNRATKITETAFEYYGLKKHFPIRKLRAFDVRPSAPFSFLLSSFVFAVSVAASLDTKQDRIIFSRDELVLYLLHFCVKSPYVWESHTGSWNYAARYVAKHAKYIVVISQGLRDFYIEQGISAEKILVAPDSIDVADFSVSRAKADARTELDLPQSAKIVLYAGRLDGFKGVDTLCKASILLSEALVVVVGGEPQELEKNRRLYPNMRFLGQKPYKDLPHIQQAADVLVLPNSGTDMVSARFTSPMKLFAYMASGVPIVASDLPSIREVLDTECGTFFTPDDSESLATTIRNVLEQASESEKKAEAAKRKVSHYTWDSRVGSILDKLVD